MSDKAEIIIYVVKTDNEMMGAYELGAINEESAKAEFDRIVQTHPRPKEWPWKLHRITCNQSDEVISS